MTKIKVDKDLLRSLLVMGAMVEARDAYTGGHLWRVSQYARLLALDIGLSENEALQVSIGGYLHDVGKIGIPDNILNKQASLNEQEYNIIKTHPRIGTDLVREHPLAILAIDAIHHHHEKVNGTGYPDGLNDDSLSLHARIIGLVDAFDAMTSTRPYHKAMSIDSALDILKQERDQHFDARLVDHFLSLKQGNHLDHIANHSDHEMPLLSCPHCGPVIEASKFAQDGDTLICKICGSKLRLHRKGYSFEIEDTGKQADISRLRPEVNTDPIDDFLYALPNRLAVRPEVISD